MIGAHVSSGDPLAEAELRGAEVVQVFLSNPQSWKAPLPRSDVQTLLASPIRIYVHAPYLINVASANNRVRIPSRKILAQTCEAASAIGAAGVVVHGGHVTEGGPIEEGFVRWRKALESFETEMPILIENTAGGEGALARSFDTLARLLEEIGDLGPGLCLDTCHAWAAGEDLATAASTLATIGRLDLVHLNDSRDPFGSRRDRHANLGEGEIPAELLVGVVRDAQVDVIVETPGGAEAQADDISWLADRL